MKLRADAAGRPTAVRLSPSEQRIIDRAAAVNRQSRSAFVRDATLGAASECLEGVPGRSVRRQVMVLRTSEG